MKCPNCGAEIGATSKACEFCGSQLSFDMRKEQEQLNKHGCPKCQSTNILFKRENQGEIRNKKSKRIVHRTVGLCKDCGYTWYPNTANEFQMNNKIWWVLGWIFFFPAPIMVLIWRKKNRWDIKVKIALTLVFWLAFLAIGLFGNKNDANNPNKEIATGTSGEIITGEANESIENMETIYELNDNINEFINYFNKYNQNDNITKEMAKPYYHHGQDHEDQIMYIENGYKIVISGGTLFTSIDFHIGNTPGTSHTNDEYKEMFKKYLKGFNLELDETQMDSDWEILMNDLTNNVRFDEYEASASVYNGKIESIKVIKKK